VSGERAMDKDNLGGLLDEYQLGERRRTAEAARLDAVGDVIALLAKLARAERSDELAKLAPLAAVVLARPT
jgi:hypothetical protein